MQHSCHLGPIAEPACHFQTGFLLLREPHAHRAHPAQRHPAIVGAGILAQPARARVQRGPVLVAVHRDAADQDIGVPGWIFGRRLDRDIDAMPERLEVMDAPRVVQHHLDFARNLPRAAIRMRRACDGRNILHLERVAAGAFRIDDGGIGPHQRGDAGAIDQRIVERRLDTKPFEHALGEIARWAIDAVGHQAVIAGLQKRQQRGGHRGKAGADDGAACAALDLGDDVFQRPVRRAAAKPIIQHTLAAHSRQAFALGDRRRQNGGPTQQRRVDEAVRGLVRPPGVRQPGAKSEAGTILVHISFSLVLYLPAYRHAHPIRSTIRHTPRLPAGRPGANQVSGCTR